MSDRVDFYILETADAGTRETFCCRLAEKAWQQGYRVFVRTADTAAASGLDDRLWSFRQGSFVPHAVVSAAEGEPVQIGDTLPDGPAADLLINLGEDVPDGWDRYPRIAEVVNQEPDVVGPGRARFRHYRDAGIEPQPHRLQR
ncbi:MAG TPA: DNA polymerase III subunit chi [Gammaproteobacteria bacterium]|nr:DNA polymerase III subunit chi [Gammaproteobacteria bacterium]